MKLCRLLLCLGTALPLLTARSANIDESAIKTVIETPGLVGFWTFGESLRTATMLSRCGSVLAQRIISHAGKGVLADEKIASAEGGRAFQQQHGA